MTIGIDMMGGDYAPLEAVKGIVAYFASNAANAHLVLIGDEEQLGILINEYELDTNHCTIVPSASIIGMNEHPTKAFKEKRDSSIAIGFGMLANGKIDAFIGAGNTGAMLVGTMFSIKTIEGVLRPTICTIVPKVNSKTGIILDVGLNVDCKPEMLNQFATLGSAYAEDILGIKNPTVGLLNIGEEEGKGDVLAKSTYPLLKENKSINFYGNIEGRDILEDKVDIAVCDGFTGNILLKLLESLHPITVSKGINQSYFERFNFEQYGGSPVLGVEKPVIIGHGISGAEAFMNMIFLAEKIISTDLLGKMKAMIAV